MRPRHPELGNTIPVPHECSDLCYFCMRQFCLPYVFSRSIAGVLRAHASGALHHLALLGGEKKIMQKRIAASQKI